MIKINQQGVVRFDEWGLFIHSACSSRFVFLVYSCLQVVLQVSNTKLKSEMILNEVVKQRGNREKNYSMTFVLNFPKVLLPPS